MLRITFPYILFISLVSLAGGILNTWSRFAIPALTPALLNLSFIFGALFFSPFFDPPVMVLAWAVFVGGVLQLALQIPALARIGMLPRPALGWSDPGVRRIVVLMGPAAFGVSVGQVSILINTIFASYLDNGSVSWLYYADRLMEFPTGLLGWRWAPFCSPACRNITPPPTKASIRSCSTGACASRSSLRRRPPSRWHCFRCRSSRRCFTTGNSASRTSG